MSSLSVIDLITKYYGYSYIIPLVCSFGIICNIINLTVLTNRRLKESPYSYLTGLACSDLLALLFTFTTTFTRGHWLITPPNYVNANNHLKSALTMTTNSDNQTFAAVALDALFIPPLFQTTSTTAATAEAMEAASAAATSFTTEYWLKKLEKRLFLPSANFFSAMSVSITMALTIERYLFIKFPMHASGFCSPKNARYIIIILTYFVFFFRLPMYFFADAAYIYSNQTASSSSSISATPTSTTTRTSSNITAASTAVAAVMEPIIIGVKINKYYEGFQKFYFLFSFVIFEIVPFFTLSILNWNLILLVKNSIREFDDLRLSNAEELNENLLNNQQQAAAAAKSTRNNRRQQQTPPEYTLILQQSKDLETINENNSRRQQQPQNQLNLSMSNLNLNRAPRKSDTPSTTNYDMTNVRFSTSATTTHMPSSHSFISSKSEANIARISVNQQLRVNKRRKDQLKLTRTLIAVVCITLLSEISSIITYDKITELLIAKHFKDYMKRIYPFQVFISNMITLALHSLNFFLYCAFNRKYLDTFRQTYGFCFKYLKYIRCKKTGHSQSVNQSISLCNIQKLN